MRKEKALKIYNSIKKKYGQITTALVYKNAFELLVATILSAQCTDVRVNKITKELFEKYKTAKDFSCLTQIDLEKIIKATGFYKAKSKNIITTSKMILEKFNGKVPERMEDLVSLAGVARKTANIVLYHAYGKNVGIAVDTHVKRLSFRMGFTKETNPEKIEKDLMKLFPKHIWGELTNMLIEHGRKTCKARSPKCGECVIKKECSKLGL